MSTVIIIIHIMVCVALILIVLLQTGKGADIGAAFGAGSSQTLFGAGGASTFLSKLTTVAAAVFMLTSLGLAYMSSHKSADSIMTNVVVTPPQAPAQQPAAIPQGPPLTGSRPEPAQQEGMITVPTPGTPVQQEGAVTLPKTNETPKASAAQAAAPQPAAKSKPAKESKGDF